MNETYKMTFNKIAVYVLTAILSSLVLGSLLASVEILFFEDSWGFFPTLLVVALYTLPVYFVCAVPFSLFIEYSSKTKAISFIKKNSTLSNRWCCCRICIWSIPFGGSRWKYPGVCMAGSIWKYGLSSFLWDN